MSSNALEVIEKLKSNVKALSQEVEATVREVTPEAADMLMKPLRSSLLRLESNRFVIAIVGRQKSGKSTLMNALVGDGELVSPVNARVWTSALSVVKYSARPFAVVHVDPALRRPAPMDGVPNFDKPVDQQFLESTRNLIRNLLGRDRQVEASEPSTAHRPRQLESFEIVRADLDQWVTHRGNAENHKGVVLAEVFSPSRLLEGGLVLVDSPGIGALSQSDVELAGLVAEEVDATILVYSREANLGRDEMDFLVQALALRAQRQNTGRRVTRKVFIVQNDRGHNPDDSDAQSHDRDCQDVANDTRRNIEAEWFRRQKNDPHFPLGIAPSSAIIRLNAKRAENGTLRGDQRLVDESNLPHLREALMSFYSEGRARRQVTDVWHELLFATNEVQRQVQSRLKVLTDELWDASKCLQELIVHKSRITNEQEDISRTGLRSRIHQALSAELGRVDSAIRDATRQASDRIKELADKDVAQANAAAEAMLADAIRACALELDKEDGHVAAEHGRLTQTIADHVSAAHRFVNQTADAGERRPLQTRSGFARTAVFLHAEVEGGLYRAGLARINSLATWLSARDRSQTIREQLLTAVGDTRRRIIADFVARVAPIVQARAHEALESLYELRSAARAMVEQLYSSVSKTMNMRGFERAEHQRQLEAEMTVIADLRSRIDEHMKNLDGG